MPDSDRPAPPTAPDGPATDTDTPADTGEPDVTTVPGLRRAVPGPVGRPTAVPGRGAGPPVGPDSGGAGASDVPRDGGPTGEADSGYAPAASGRADSGMRSEQAGAVATPAVPDRVDTLPAELTAVIGRWNPQGAALLRAVAQPEPAPGTGSGVVLYAVDDANTTLLRTELARFEPRIDLLDPATAAPACALVLFDAGSVLGADLLTLIDRLRAADRRIVLAMNGFHAYADWQRIRERSLALLAARGCADLDIIPVSARLAAAARAADDSALLDRSGLAGLHAALAAATARAPAVRVDRGDAVLARVLAETEARITEQLGALRAGTESSGIRAERVALLAERDGGRQTGLAAVRSQVQLARVDLTTEVGASIRALHTRSRTELDRCDRAELRAYPRRLHHAAAQLSTAVDVAIDDRVIETARRVGTAEPAARRHDPAPNLGPDPDPRHRGVEDHLMIALGASAGVGLGRLVVAPLSLVPALDAATVPVTLLLGAGVAYWVVRARAQLAERNHLAQWVAEALVNLKALLEQRVAAVLVDVEAELAEHVVRESTARAVEVDRRVAELDARARRLAAERPAQLTACEKDLAVLARHPSTIVRPTGG
ncbi:hypothetical protein [Nocardia rhizosphaerae]|uniref:Dynamin family protein n=1 Tax=Nocardia rhizosphaerae TaxID=1691571 RepID=A0ABV8KZ03_9NOCA